MRLALIIATLTVSLRVKAAPAPCTPVQDNNRVYFAALSQLESNDNDRAHGRHGEISRYQILRRVWHQATSLSVRYATDPEISFSVAVSIVFNRTHGNIITPKEFAIAWHCPNAHRLNREQREYVSRFCNLVEKLQHQPQFSTP